MPVVTAPCSGGHCWDTAVPILLLVPSVVHQGWPPPGAWTMCLIMGWMSGRSSSGKQEERDLPTSEARMTDARGRIKQLRGKHRH